VKHNGDQSLRDFAGNKTLDQKHLLCVHTSTLVLGSLCCVTRVPGGLGGRAIGRAELCGGGAVETLAFTARAKKLTKEFERPMQPVGISVVCLWSSPHKFWI